jgi:YidC/Oxa1 family membrane protein insertase
MFNVLFESVAFALDFFYRLYPSYAVAIVLLTVVVHALSFPLTAASTKSMAGLSKLGPQLREVQDRHRDDPVRGNEETRALMRASGVSTAGCLSGLLQAPMFFVVYRVLRGLTATGPGGVARPRYLVAGSALRAALTRDQGRMPWFGIDLARSASHTLATGFVAGLPYLLLVAALIGVAYLGHRQAQRRAPAAAPASGSAKGAAKNDPPTAALTRQISALMPLTYLFTVTLPAGVVVYLCCSAVARLVQQALIYKFVVR